MRHLRLGAPQFLDRERVRALLLTQIAQQRVGGRIARGLPVEDVDGVVLGSFGRGEQPVDGRDPCLQAPPERHAHALRRGDLDPELTHAPLQALAVPRFGQRHTPQDLGFACGHPHRDQLI